MAGAGKYRDAPALLSEIQLTGSTAEKVLPGSVQDSRSGALRSSRRLAKPGSSISLDFAAIKHGNTGMLVKWQRLRAEGFHAGHFSLEFGLHLHGDLHERPVRPKHNRDPAS